MVRAGEKSLVWWWVLTPLVEVCTSDLKWVARRKLSITMAVPLLPTTNRHHGEKQIWWEILQQLVRFLSEMVCVMCRIRMNYIMERTEVCQVLHISPCGAPDVLASADKCQPSRHVQLLEQLGLRTHRLSALLLPAAPTKDANYNLSVFALTTQPSAALVREEFMPRSSLQCVSSRSY